MKKFYTTCEIAKFCGVSRITVKNWLEKNTLPYFRTSGGHRRVKRDDLLDYLTQKNYPLEQFLKFEEEIKSKKKDLYCWEYFSKHFTKDHPDKCNQCLVFLSKSYLCYALADAVGDSMVFCDQDCADCEYFTKYHGKGNRAC